MKNFNAQKAKDLCVQWIREWFECNGDGCNAVIGISGGKDSSVVAALCVEALDKDRVFGVLMPDRTQMDIGDSYELVRHLEIDYAEINVGPAISGVYQGFIDNAIATPSEGSPFLQRTGVVLSNQAEINLPARIRMATLYAVSQSVNGRVANTCNLSENWIGYSTRWGDAVGDFAPIAHFTSEEVSEIGYACGLPRELTHKTPADGLCGKTDEDNFGFSYAVLNRYILTQECDDPAIKEKIDYLHNKNLFKLRPIPEFVPVAEDMLWS